MKKKDSHKQKSQIPLVFDKFYFKNHCFATVRGMPFIYLGIQHITQCQQGLLPVLSEKKKNGTVDLKLTHMGVQSSSHNFYKFQGWEAGGHIPWSHHFLLLILSSMYEVFVLHHSDANVQLSLLFKSRHQQQNLLRKMLSEDVWEDGVKWQQHCEIKK